MPTQGKVKTLFSGEDNTEAVFPRTKISAVSDSDGTGLDAILDKAVYTGELTDETSTAPVNADSLGGILAENYATQAFVTNKIAEAQLDGGDGSTIDLSGYATKDDLAAIDYPVDSVNGKTGEITLTASDVGALNLQQITDDEHLVPESADLNNYTTVGAYRIATAAIAVSLANTPPNTSVGGRLIVSGMSGTSGVVQILIFNTTNIQMWIRVQNYLGTWGEWKKFFTQADTVPIENGGTGATSAEDALTALGAVSKSGDTMTGELKLGGGIATVGDTWNAFAFKSATSGNPVRGSVMVSNTNRMHFNQQETGASYAERYQLPAMATGLTADVWYRIITTKAAKVLWTNASPGSAFAAQTITVNGLSNCECIAVIFGQITGTSNAAFPLIAHKSVSLSTNTNVNAVRYDATNSALYNVERWITINFANNTIVFSAGKQNGETQNERAIPIAVIGLY